MQIETNQPVEIKLTAEELSRCISAEVAKAFSSDTTLIEKLVYGLLNQKKESYSRYSMFQEVVSETLREMIREEVKKQASEQWPKVQSIIAKEFGERFANDELLAKQFSESFGWAMQNARFYFQEPSN